MEHKLDFLTADERIILSNHLAMNGLVKRVSDLTGQSPQVIYKELALSVGVFINTLSEDDIKTKIENIRTNEREGKEAAIRDFKALNN